MLRASEVLPFNASHEADAAAITVTLNQDQRYRRRIALTTDDGLEFLLDLPEAVMLQHGDGLKLEDGRVITVQAVPEELLEVRPQDAHHMVRLAWHLGNRHLEAQIQKDRILIRRDRVIADMLKTLGAELTEVVEPFTPEAGAYAHHHGEHSHDH